MKFRLRFSGTLAILVTLVCAYFAVWEATKRFAVLPPPGHQRMFTIGDEKPIMPTDTEDDSSILMANALDSGVGVFVILSVNAPAPLLIVEDQQTMQPTPGAWGRRRVYFVWLFGPKIKLFQKALPFP